MLSGLGYYSKRIEFYILMFISYFFFFPNLILNRLNIDEDKERQKYKLAKLIIQCISILLTTFLIWLFSEEQFDFYLFLAMSPGLAHKIALSFYNGMTNSKEDCFFD